MEYENVKPDLVGMRKWWYALSLFVTVFGIIFMIRNVVTDQQYHSPLRLGLDFTGGVIIQLQFNKDEVDLNKVSTEEIFKVVQGITEKEPQIQITDNAKGKLVHIRADSSLIQKEKHDTLLEKLNSEIGPSTEMMSEEITPVVSRELMFMALKGLFWGSILILIYVSLRMSWDFAVFAVVALIHDILVLTGIFAFLQKEVNSYFVATILTIVGYSINDTIVIYDRIRENSKIYRSAPFDKVVNLSLVQTLARSINTVLTVLFCVAALYFWGGASIRDFALALWIGITSGCYSSIFNASQLLVSYRLYKAKGRVVRAEEMLKKEEIADISSDQLEEEEEAKRAANTAAKKKRKRRY
jgi:preprotein translocase subunit SecF